MREINLLAEQVLYSVGQVSLTTALVILPLLALRKWLRRRYPARVLCIVWAALLVRLLVPVQLSLPRAPVRVTPRLTQVRYTDWVETGASALPNGQPSAQAALGPDGEDFTPILSGQDGGLSAVTTPGRDGGPSTVPKPNGDPSALTAPGRNGQPSVPASAWQGWIATAEASALGGTAETTCYGAILCLLWADVALLLFGGQLMAYLRYARRLRRSARAVESPALLAACQAERERLGVRRQIPLMQSPLADGPMLAGLLRPVLLLPPEGLPEEAAPLILRHELIHYKRRDLWRKLAASAARCLHWFNPAVYWLTQALYEDIELACDSRVIEGMDEAGRRRYGAAILNCAASQIAEKQPLTTCFHSGREALRTRLGELFSTGAKKRGAALLLTCALLIGMVGGAVSIGGARDAETPLGDAEALARRELTEEAAVILAGAWADGWIGRDLLPALPYLTTAFRQTVCGSQWYAEIGDGTPFFFSTREPVTNSSRENENRAWTVGRYAPDRAVVPDLQNNGAYVIYIWQENGAPDARLLEYVHFEREGGAWRISGVDGSMDEYGEAVDDRLNTAEKFRLLYGNDLGLPDFLVYAGSVSERRAAGHTNIYPAIDDPVAAVEDLFGLEGGSGAATGWAVVDPDGSGSVKVFPYADPAAVPSSLYAAAEAAPAYTPPAGETYTPSHLLGCNVRYTFADGSAVDVIVSDQTGAGGLGEGYIPVDWSMDGKNTRTMLDLACQWAAGTIHRDTHVMFPLLTGAGAEDLIAVQQAYSGTEGDEWYWTHGKYGSTPSAEEYGVYFDMGEDTARIVYVLSAGELRFRESELLHFVDTPAGLKIDRVSDLIRSEEEARRGLELIDCTEQEWFAMHYIAEPVASSLSNPQSGYGSGPETHRAYMDDPVETTKVLLQIGNETQADASLVEQSDRQALVRLDFEGGGDAFVTLDYDPDRERWLVTAIDDESPVPAIRSAEEFAEEFVVAYASSGFPGWGSSLPEGGRPLSLEADAIADFCRLDRSSGLDIQTEPAELIGRPFGTWCMVTFPDGSQVRLLFAEYPDGGGYPVDWTVNGESIRTMEDLARQWAGGWGARDTRLLYPIVSRKGRHQLDELQGDDEFFAENWRLATYLPTTTGYQLRQTGEDEMEIVYTEIGRGLFNHQTVQRLRFVTEDGSLRIAGWEDVPFEDGNDYEWYRRYCLPSLEHYTTAKDRLAIGDLAPMEERKYYAMEFAGVNDHEQMEAEPQSVTENVMVSDGQGVERPCCQVVLRFTDGSGWLTVWMYPGTADGFDGEAIPVWNLAGLTLTNHDPDG